MVNLVSAAAIGTIIFVMSLLKSGYLKALVYSLPIPITIALVATNGRINTSNVIGLALLTLFLWSVYWLVKRRMNIYLADIAASALYIGLGYGAIKLIHIPFIISVIIYLLVWIIFTVTHKHRNEQSIKLVSKLPPLTKLPIVTALAFLLLSLKNLLAGVVVTFPYSGVFAVVESRSTLLTLAATFTRNSIAILAMFITMFYLNSLVLGIRIALGWIVYVVVLISVSKVAKYFH